MTILYTIGIIFVFFAISFVLINVRQIFIGKEFHGTCSSNNPLLKNKVGDCMACGRKADGTCDAEKAKAHHA